jgi:hypothetical protein
MSHYKELLNWIESEQEKFPDEDIQNAEMVAYATLELVKRKIMELEENNENHK